MIGEGHICCRGCSPQADLRSVPGFPVCGPVQFVTPSLFCSEGWNVERASFHDVGPRRASARPRASGHRHSETPSRAPKGPPPSGVPSHWTRLIATPRESRHGTGRHTRPAVVDGVDGYVSHAVDGPHGRTFTKHRKDLKRLARGRLLILPLCARDCLPSGMTDHFSEPKISSLH